MLFTSRPMMDATLITLSGGENCISLRFVCRGTKRSRDPFSHQYLIVRDSLLSWLNFRAPKESYITKDLGTFIEMRLSNDRVFVDFTVTRPSVQDEYSFRVPASLLQAATQSFSGEQRTYLSVPEARTERYDFSNAQKPLQEIQKDKLAKRALCKALQRNFQWGGSISFYPDWNNRSFFFRESGMSGGLILHEETRKDGRKMYRYSVHT